MVEPWPRAAEVQWCSETLQVRQCSHGPVNPQTLEQDPRAKDVRGTSLDTV